MCPLISCFQCLSGDIVLRAGLPGRVSLHRPQPGRGVGEAADQVVQSVGGKVRSPGALQIQPL